MFHFPGRQPGAKKKTKKAGMKKDTKSASSRSSQQEDEPTAVVAPRNTLSRSSGGKYAALPEMIGSKSRNRLRACMICSLVKSEHQFEVDGCDNCESFLHFAGTRGSVISYTSGNFEGVIAMMSPNDSWVSKWQHISTLKPGMYAVNVQGELEEFVKKELEDAGRQIICRDKSVRSMDAGKEYSKSSRSRRRESVALPEEEGSENGENLENEGVEESVVDEPQAHANGREEESSSEANVHIQQEEGRSEGEEQEKRVPSLTILKSEPTDPEDNRHDDDDSMSMVAASTSSKFPYRSGRRYTSSSDSSTDDSD